MNCCLYLVFSVFTFEVTLKVSSKKTLKASFWTYEDQEHWSGERCKGGGLLQSPINIRTSNVTDDYWGEFIRGHLQFIGYNNVLMTAVHNGHTIQYSCEGDKMMHPIVSGGPLKHKYRLEQVHFHWLSEHALDGSRFPMEMHLVHVRADLKVNEALKNQDGMAIIAIFVEVKSQLMKEQDELVEELMAPVPKLKKMGDRMSGILINLYELVRNPRKYFTYMGSLTSPECNEVVIWIIMETPLQISKAQHHNIITLHSGRQNARHLQPVRHHRIYRSHPIQDLVTTPYIVLAARNTYNYFAEFMGNFTKLLHLINEVFE